MSKKFNATESLWYKGVATFCSGVENTDWNFQISVILQEIRSAWWQLALLMNACLLWMDGHVMNSRRANLEFVSELRVRHEVLFFISVVRKNTKARLKSFTFFLLYSVVKSFCCLWNEQLNKWPLAMKRAPWMFSGFQTHDTVTGAGMRRKQRGRARIGRSRQQFSNSCACGTG